nr:OTUBAIN-like deubiquitinase 2 plus [Chlamydomonas reinhardtii]
MARKVRETHAALASAIEAAAARASAAASAALLVPPEAHQLESLIRELQAARVSGRAGGGNDGAWAPSEGLRSGSNTYDSRTATAATAPSTAAGDSYGYQEVSTSSTTDRNNAAAGRQYMYSSRSSLEHAPAQPASPEHMYGLTSPSLLAAASQRHASSRPGPAAPASSSGLDYWEGAGPDPSASASASAASAGTAAVDEAVHALRMHREMQRLQAVQEAAAAARTPGAGGGGTVLGVSGVGFAREVWGHRSQQQLAPAPYGGEPLASSTSTLTYPWQREYVELYGGSCATAGGRTSNGSRQQPAESVAIPQTVPASPEKTRPAAQYQASPSLNSAAYDWGGRSAGLYAAGDPPATAYAAAPVAAATGQHLGGYSTLAGSSSGDGAGTVNGDYAAVRARLVAHSSGSSVSYGSGIGSGYAGPGSSSTAPAVAPAAVATVTSGGRSGSTVRLRMQDAPPSTTAAPTSLLSGAAGGGTDLPQPRSRRNHYSDILETAGRTSSRARTNGPTGNYSAAAPQPARTRDLSSSVSWRELEAEAREPAAPEAAAHAAATWPRGATSVSAVHATSTSRVRTVTQSAQEAPSPFAYDLPSLQQQKPASRTYDSRSAVPTAPDAADSAARVQARFAGPAATNRDDNVSPAPPHASRAYPRGRGGGDTGTRSNGAEPAGAAAPAASPSLSPSPSPHRHGHVSSQQLVADTDRALELYDEAQLQRAIQLSKQEAARAALAAAGMTGLTDSSSRHRDGDKDGGGDSLGPSHSPRPSSRLRSSSPLLEHLPRIGGATTPRRVAVAAAMGSKAALQDDEVGRPGSVATPSRRRLGNQEAGAAASVSPRSTEVQAPPASQAAATEEPGSSNSSSGMLVSALAPLTALHQRYADLLPLLCAKLVSLEDDFPITRRVAGDGNCFYRAALFGLLEHVLAAPDPQLAERLDLVVSRHLARLDEPQFQQQPPPTSPAANDGRGAGMSPLRLTPARGDPAFAPMHASPGQPAAAAAAAGAQVPPRDDPAAYRGGQRLLRLLRTAWFKCPDAPRPSDVSSLERLFNSVEQSGEVIRFARSLTARELMAAEEFYTPFIPGCGGDYTGLTLRQICERHVLPMGVEVEQLQIIAACTALGVTLAVLDVAGSAVGAIKHGPAAQQHGPPVAWVAHLPGHYDVIYPARPLDVAPGGQLVAAII